MPELVEQMYCSQQIVVPPKFPYILKRYCKAAIKTQPYDLLRWSYEYFKALSEHRPPPVKLRLEYPVYSTEGGLTRGCLKVLASQLSGMTDVPIPAVKEAWGGFCLDPNELKRILCLCEVYLRSETVPFLHFIAVAGGLLTKSLTHTMILLCESLTKEPDGGSAAIHVRDFLTMYIFLAKVDASQDVKYLNGYREGQEPEPELSVEEEEVQRIDETAADSASDDDFWADSTEGPIQLQKLALINAHVARNSRLSLKMMAPAMGKIERSPSIERERQIERENYQRERRGRVSRSDDVDKKLRQMSAAKMSTLAVQKEEAVLSSGSAVKLKEEKKVVEKKKEGIEIFVYDEEDVEIPYVFYGEPKDIDADYEEGYEDDENLKAEEEVKVDEVVVVESEKDKVAFYVAESYRVREERLEDLERTFDEIAGLVDRFQAANYDLGMVAGRQMSTTSGEFIVQHIEREILAYIDDQIAILPDPDLKKKKAKPEEVAMIRDLLETFLDENMDIIVPEVEEVEEEEVPIPEVTVVYAVPGIGPPVDEDIITEFESYAYDACKVQGELFMPRNVRHFLCPPLEKYVEHNYENQEKKKEEAPLGGAITE